jgi:hypothetical protein
VSLGIPDALLAAGRPQTATELAACIGPSTHVDWLDRLLSAAAVMGMMKRRKVGAAEAHRRMAGRDWGGMGGERGAAGHAESGWVMSTHGSVVQVCMRCTLQHYVYAWTGKGADGVLSLTG